MSGNASLCDSAPTILPGCVRVDARLRLGVARLDGQSRLTDRHEAGAFRFRFPKAHGRPPEAVLVNVSGGLAGGDSVSIDLHIGPAAEATLASATAERIYRSDGAPTTLANNLRLGARASLVWLPQETILYDRAAVKRVVSVDLAPESRLVMGEMIMFGRIAAGEVFSGGAIHDRWRLRHAGRLVLADDLRLDLGHGEALRQPMALGEANAISLLVFALPEPEGLLEALRSRMPDDSGVEIGATLVDGLVLVRAAGKDAAGLRRAHLDLARFAIGRTGLPYPRAFTNE